jgi:hypothetical protein
MEPVVEGLPALARPLVSPRRDSAWIVLTRRGRRAAELDGRTRARRPPREAAPLPRHGRYLHCVPTLSMYEASVDQG